MAVKEASSARPSARERLLAAANELFYNEGVHTVGIDRVIEQAGVAKVGGGVQQVAGDGVVWVLAELVRGQHPDQMLDGIRAEEQQQDPADDLKDAVQAFQHQADLEGLVERR